MSTRRRRAGGRPEPLVRVLVDPEDDARVTAAALAWHAPGAGQVCVHPTPATRSAAALAHDVLAAFGRPPGRFAAERLGGGRAAWRAAAAWMHADGPRELVVLRADRLAGAGWAELLQVCQRTGVRLTLVCHRATVPPMLLAVLDDVPHELKSAEQLHQLRHDGDRDSGLASSHVDDGDHRTTALLPATVCGRAGRALPRVGYAVTCFRRRAFERLGPATFAAADAQYGAAAEATERWLAGWRGPTRYPGVLERDLFLCQVVYDSPGPTHTLIRLRGYEAGFRRRGLVVRLPPPAQLLDPAALGGPGLTRRPFTMDVVDGIRDGVAHPVVAAGVATVLLTGMTPAALAVASWADLDDEAAGLYLHQERTSRSKPTVTAGLLPLANAVAAFWIPPAVRPLLQAARHFSAGRRGDRDRDERQGARMFPADLFNQRLLHEALKASGVRPAHQVARFDRVWLTRRSHEIHLDAGTAEDAAEFLADQAFDPAHGCDDSDQSRGSGPPPGPLPGEGSVPGGGRNDA